MGTSPGAPARHGDPGMGGTVSSKSSGESVGQGLGAGQRRAGGSRLRTVFWEEVSA